MHYITLHALAALVLLYMQYALAEEPTSTTTSTTTRTTVVSTYWVVLTSAAGTVSTLTTSGTATGSTIGVTTVTGSHISHSPSSSSTSTLSVATNMAWEGRSFQDAVLNSTNYFRAQHEAKPVSWSDKLASYAQDHADECNFKHSGGSYGENLAQGYPSPALAIDGWADEEADYDYEKRKFSEDVGHFTQLVWKNTTSVGCGAKDCDGKGWLLVCEYDPAGNMVGEFGTNVGKAGQDEDGEPGLGAAVGKGVCGRLLVALVAVSVLAGLYV